MTEKQLIAILDGMIENYILEAKNKSNLENHINQIRALDTTFELMVENNLMSYRKQATFIELMNKYVERLKAMTL